MCQENKQQSNRQPEYLFIKSGYKIIKVNLREIYFLESSRDYTIVHTGEGKLKTLQSLGSIEDRLPEGQFVRIHKSFVIAIDKIVHIERSHVYIHNKHLHISKIFRKSFLQTIGVGG